MQFLICKERELLSCPFPESVTDICLQNVSLAALLYRGEFKCVVGIAFVLTKWFGMDTKRRWQFEILLTVVGARWANKMVRNGHKMSLAI